MLAVVVIHQYRFDFFVVEGVHSGAPLGISNGFISSAQITSSSDYNANHDTKGVRLLRSMIPVSSWAARLNNNQQWVQVDLLQVIRITGVATQGRNRFDQWVTTYKIQYSNNGVNWQTYKEDGQDKVSVHVFLPFYLSVCMLYAFSLHSAYTGIYY